MSQLSELLNTRVKKTTKFMGTDVNIHKMSYNEVLDIQTKGTAIDAMENGPEKEKASLELILDVAGYGFYDADVTREALKNAPMDELSNIAEEIMDFSGVRKTEPGKIPSPKNS